MHCQPKRASYLQDQYPVLEQTLAVAIKLQCSQLFAARHNGARGHVGWLQPGVGESQSQTAENTCGCEKQDYIVSKLSQPCTPCTLPRATRICSIKRGICVDGAKGFLMCPVSRSKTNLPDRSSTSACAGATAKSAHVFTNVWRSLSMAAKTMMNSKVASQPEVLLAKPN